MANVLVEILRYTDSHQPGWVECRLVDSSGHSWCFEEKVPVVTGIDLDVDSHYPCPGSITCVVVDRVGDVVRVVVNAVSGDFECNVRAALVVE